MMIITVSGSHSAVGKTFVVERLLNALDGWSALKVTVAHNGSCPTGRNCGACAGMDSGFRILSDKKVIGQRGKDTHRFKKAGAAKVAWLQSEPGALKQGLKAALGGFTGARGVIIESTSALKHLRPDLAIFVKGKGAAIKPSAGQVIKKADLILTV